MGKTPGRKREREKGERLGRFRGFISKLGRVILPPSTRRGLVRLGQRPPIGLVRYGSLRRLKPISRNWGFERGLPVDRYYIENFLRQHKEDIRGRVLELKDRTYTLRFGGDRVTKSDVLHKEPGNPEATIVADLAASPAQLEASAFDAIILTQTLQFIYDFRMAIKTLYMSLRSSGSLLITVPGISQVSRYDLERWGDYWRFTSLSVERILEDECPGAALRVDAHGNVLAAIASLHGIASDELRPEELDAVDPDYQVVITARVKKP